MLFSLVSAILILEKTERGECILKPNHTEGELYKIYHIDGHIFEIFYGYYEEEERKQVEPLPIFPDFLKQPAYTSKGQPIVTRIQLPCKYYKPPNKEFAEDWCGDCTYFEDAEQEIARCTCEKKQLR